MNRQNIGSKQSHSVLAKKYVFFNPKNVLIQIQLQSFLAPIRSIFGYWRSVGRSCRLVGRTTGSGIGVLFYHYCSGFPFKYGPLVQEHMRPIWKSYLLSFAFQLTKMTSILISYTQDKVKFSLDGFPFDISYALVQAPPHHARIFCCCVQTSLLVSVSQYLSKSTKITTNTATEMLSSCVPCLFHALGNLTTKLSRLGEGETTYLEFGKQNVIFQHQCPVFLTQKFNKELNLQNVSRFYGHFLPAKFNV